MRSNFKKQSTSVSSLMILLTLSVNLLSCDSKPSSEAEKNHLETINIGRLICGGHLPLAIVEKKYQDDLKTFHLNTVQNQDWLDVVRDMKSGNLAGTFILSPLAMNLIKEGLQAKIVLMADRNGNGFVLSNKIKSITELKSKKTVIAVPHKFSQHHVLLHTILKKHGIKNSNVKVVAIPPRDMINSLRNELIDGFVVGEPEGNKAISLGVGWMAAISPHIWKDHMDHVFLASNSFIKEQPEKLQELVTQLVRGAEFIEKNPTEAAVMGEDYTGSSAEVFEKVLTTPPDWITYSNLIINHNDMTSMANKLVEMKLWNNVPDDLISKYFDMSFVVKAEKNVRGR